MDKMMLFLLLCILHVAGDYYLQSEKMSETKKENFKGLGMHMLLYCIPFAVCGIADWISFRTQGVSRLMLSCVVCHIGIDLLKYVAVKYKLKDKYSGSVYVIDQFLHFTTLGVLAYTFNNQLPQFPERVVTAIPYILYFICLLKPANITYKILFYRFQPAIKYQKEDEGPKKMTENENKIKNGTEAQEKEIIGAGAWIGNLERLLSGTFILLGQFSAVGLTMTAKSIARYDKIVKNPVFAEYYLIGTLYSILYTVVLYCIIFRFAI